MTTPADEITACLERAAADECLAQAQAIRSRLPASDEVLAKAYVSVARVEMLDGRLIPSARGEWSILAGVDNEDEGIVDIAAFNLSGTRYATLLGEGYCLGLSDMYRARWLGPPVAVHTNVMSWIKADCRGLMPFDWERTAVMLKAHDVYGVVATNIGQGRAIEERLARALVPPRVLVRGDAVEVAP